MATHLTSPDQLTRFPDLIDTYAKLAAVDWIGGYGSLLSKDDAKHRLLSGYVTELASNRTAAQVRFQEKIQQLMEKKHEVVSFQVGKRSVINAVMRWRPYNGNGVRGVIGKLNGKYPYVYAPDFFMNTTAADATQTLVDLIPGVARQFADLTGRNSSIKLVVDTHEANTVHQTQLMNLGFTAGRPQVWPASDAVQHIIGPTENILQYELQL